MKRGGPRTAAFSRADAEYWSMRVRIADITQAEVTMKIVTPGSTITVAVERGRHAVQLQEGVAYVMHDVEANSARQAGLVAVVQPLDIEATRILHQHGEQRSGTLLVPFIGGLGDALCILPLVETIRRCHPQLDVVISTTPGPAAVFTLADPPVRTMPYPITLEAWDAFDALMTFETVETELPGRPLTETFARGVGWTLDDFAATIRIPDELSVADVMPPSPRIGVTVPDNASVRSVPAETVQGVVQRLNDANMCVMLLGDQDPSYDIVFDANKTLDLRGQTPSVMTLAACVAELDAVVAHDSFIMHLAGALSIPAVALFAPTSAAHASPYAKHLPIASSAECAPCHTTGATCPLGHERCVAWSDDILSPASIVATLCRHLTEVYAETTT